MKSKPAVTQKLSESGQLFTPDQVATDIIAQSQKGYFSLTTGLDGWLLKQVHPGMSPVTNLAESLQQVIFAPFCRAISFFVLWDWQRTIAGFK